ncbi:hypothetical protein [Pseudomonas sp. S09G 359]|uniref:hypothetical protein n=1 Tax=Pseudomonas sp. S09G 359 TaxID=2054919 RepID=UPI0012FF1CEA|nr:hypothetical protein [Pseudomonas sp. S09G 359]
MMRFRTPSKNGVPGVPEMLKATYFVAFSGGTPFYFSWNTWCSTQKRCSRKKPENIGLLTSYVLRKQHSSGRTTQRHLSPVGSCSEGNTEHCLWRRFDFQTMGAGNSK